MLRENKGLSLSAQPLLLPFYLYFYNKILYTLSCRSILIQLWEKVQFQWVSYYEKLLLKLSLLNFLLRSKPSFLLRVMINLHFLRDYKSFIYLSILSICVFIIYYYYYYYYISVYTLYVLYYISIYKYWF